MATAKSSLPRAVPPFRPVPSVFPEAPSKLVKAFPEFKAFRDENERLFKSLVTAVKASHDDTSLNVDKAVVEASNALTKITRTASDAAQALSLVTQLEVNVDGVVAAKVTEAMETFATKDYADARKAEAISAAVEAAALDATTKANSAISTAATDATDKADAALAAAALDAQARADDALDAAIADATSKMNGAKEYSLGLVQAESGARATDVAALAYSIASLLAVTGESEAKIQHVEQVMTSTDEAMTLEIDSAKSRIGTTEAAITTITSTYATKDYADARKEEAISAAVEAAALDATTKANAAEADAATDATTKANAAILAAALDAQAKADDALDAAKDDATTKMNGAKDYSLGLVQTESGARATDVAALAYSIASLLAVTGESEAKIQHVEQVLTDADSAMTLEIDSAKSRIDTAETSITTITSTYATKEFATAKKSEAIEAAVADAKVYADGQISSLSEVYATPTQVEAKVNDVVSATLATKTSTYVSATPPTATAVGDLWIDTANSNALKRWSGTAWIDYSPGGAASSKNASFVQSVTPVATKVGDIWIDTGNSNRIKYWDGATWAESNATSAALQSQMSALATADGFLGGKYTLKVIAGNVVTGMNITSASGNGTDLSDVTFQAGSFKIYNGSTGVAPFTVSGGNVYVTGSLVLRASDVTGLGTLATKSSVSASTDVTGLGGLATKNSVDLSTTEVTNKSLANVDSAASTKLSGIAAGADVTLTALSGGVLAVGASGGLRSTNYSAGSAGWRIAGDGSAEFNNGTFRGTLNVGSGYNNTTIDSTTFSSHGLSVTGGATYSRISGAGAGVVIDSFYDGLGSISLNAGTVLIQSVPGGTSKIVTPTLECPTIKINSSTTVISGVGAAIADATTAGSFTNSWTADGANVIQNIITLRDKVNAILARMRAATPTIST